MNLQEWHTSCSSVLRTYLEIFMIRSFFTMPRMFVAFTSLAIAALGAGCTSEVSGGAGGDGGGGGSATKDPCSQEGASQSCAAPGDPPNLKEGEQTCGMDEN